MTELVIFGLIFFLLAYGAVYAVIYLPTLKTLKIEKLKITRRILSAIGGLLIVLFYLFVSPTSNNETATIENYHDKFLVTLTGKRLLMSHDPISFLKRETYVDTFRLVIPRQTGIINGTEIPTDKGNYKILGTLEIAGEKMKIDLYYDNFDDKIKDPLGWNDDYKLIRTDK